MTKSSISPIQIQPYILPFRNKITKSCSHSPEFSTWLAAIFIIHTSTILMYEESLSIAQSHTKLMKKGMNLSNRTDSVVEYINKIWLLCRVQRKCSQIEKFNSFCKRDTRDSCTLALKQISPLWLTKATQTSELSHKYLFNSPVSIWNKWIIFTLYCNMSFSSLPAKPEKNDSTKLVYNETKIGDI